MVLPEKTKIWNVIKANLPAINKSGSNGIEVLVWSQDKGLEEVKERIRGIRERNKIKRQEEASERKEIISQI